MKALFSKPLFWSNVAAFLITGVVAAGVALAWNNPTVAPIGGSGAITTDSAGNVGIGVAVPTQKLDVNGSANITGTAFVNTISAPIGPLRLQVGGLSILSLQGGTNAVIANAGQFRGIDGQPSGSGPSFSFTNDTVTGMFRPGPSTIGFTTGGAEKMRIDSSGNVGIGTVAPAYKLEVNGQIRASAGTVAYQSAAGCGGGTLTTGTTCTTSCVTGGGGGTTRCYACDGTLGFGSSPVTCSNTAVGRLVAP